MSAQKRIHSITYPHFTWGGSRGPQP